MDAATAGSYVAAGVALCVGVVNPWLTNRFVAKRQREQLDHDRGMRRREEIVALIGEAAKAGSRRFYVTDRARDQWQRALAWDDPHTQEIETERIAAVEELRDVWGRIEINFADDAAVRQRFNKWADELYRYSALVRWSHQTGLSYVPEMIKVEERRSAAAEAADRFLDAARAAVAAL